MGEYIWLSHMHDDTVASIDSTEETIDRPESDTIDSFLPLPWTIEFYISVLATVCR